MAQHASENAPKALSLDTLEDAYRGAVRAHNATLKSGTALEILTAYRTELAAKVALVAARGGPFDQVIARDIECELEQVDRDVADLRERQARVSPSRTRGRR
jgi:hypothetical protein